MTLLLAALAVGVLIGGGIGFKLGQGYERIRPTRNKSKKKKR